MSRRKVYHNFSFPSCCWVLDSPSFPSMGGTLPLLILKPKYKPNTPWILFLNFFPQLCNLFPLKLKHVKNWIWFASSLELLLPSWELNRERGRIASLLLGKSFKYLFFYDLCLSLSFHLSIHQCVYVYTYSYTYTIIYIHIYTHTHIFYHISPWAWGSAGPCIILSKLMPKLFCFTTLLLMLPVMKRFLSAWLNSVTQLVFHWKYLCHIIFSPDVLEISFSWVNPILSPGQLFLAPTVFL